MCGIFGITGDCRLSIKDNLLKRLKRLEYRGYDSCGYGTSDGIIKKSTGKISAFLDLTDDHDFNAAISHTRWATHGKVTEDNAHPHATDCNSLIAVHNGIIENYAEIKEKLEEKGYSFRSETDSEVIPKYIDSLTAQGLSMEQAFASMIDDFVGTFAVLMLKVGEGTIYAAKKDSPLVLGLADGANALASDLYALSGLTDKAIFFEDNEFAVITPRTCRFFKAGNGKYEEIGKQIATFDWNKNEESMDSYPHYMIKEIKEQPKTAKRLIQSISTVQKSRISGVAELIRQSDKIVFLGCGTSYHAGLIGAHLLTRLGINAQAIIASEFSSFHKVDNNTLIIPISQSGETMDVVSVLKVAKKDGAKIASIVNVPYSTVQRLSDISLDILAGQEISVASTKAFTNQLILMIAIAEMLGYSSDMVSIPESIAKTINDNENKAITLAEKLYNINDIFVLGKGASYPIAREISLKLKEVPYIHAEGMMAGELKHGTIALIEVGTPVISLIPNGNNDMISSTREVEARGAFTITISHKHGYFNVPKSDDIGFAIYSSIIGHLLSYHIGVLKGCEIDTPRNLAKSVTVH